MVNVVIHYTQNYIDNDMGDRCSCRAFNNVDILAVNNHLHINTGLEIITIPYSDMLYYKVECLED